jgi:hypothetical protein
LRDQAALLSEEKKVKHVHFICVLEEPCVLCCALCSATVVVFAWSFAAAVLLLNFGLVCVWQA